MAGWRDGRIANAGAARQDELHCIELEHTDYPLSVEQRQGISRARLADILSLMQHGQ